MANRWYAGFRDGKHWFPHPDCPPFQTPQAAQTWANEWAKINLGKPPLEVGEWDIKNA
jgi:hypothetical protein